jgi:hypothetical protein
MFRVRPWFVASLYTGQQDTFHHTTQFQTSDYESTISLSKLDANEYPDVNGDTKTPEGDSTVRRAEEVVVATIKCQVQARFVGGHNGRPRVQSILSSSGSKRGPWAW